ncbi:hypothetical protein ULVI_11075 [Cochleicola gelatinilyticus]|uniref:Uncharacterized protein n=1 Tax=Cochleicola gelatinilyticus TaxID=1763537 RepID=A0A167GXW9_9FLAO|nr:hypothetical protein ULVI_11075 [Cochleicola gelatinilyticus]
MLDELGLDVPIPTCAVVLRIEKKAKHSEMLKVEIFIGLKFGYFKTNLKFSMILLRKIPTICF